MFIWRLSYSISYACDEYLHVYVWLYWNCADTAILLSYPWFAANEMQPLHRAIAWFLHHIQWDYQLSLALKVATTLPGSIYKCHTVILTMLNIIVRQRVRDIVIIALQIYLFSVAESTTKFANWPSNLQFRKQPHSVRASATCCLSRTSACRASISKYTNRFEATLGWLESSQLLVHLLCFAEAG